MSSSRYPQRVSTDRFGNPFVLKACRAAYSKKQDKRYDDIQVCYMELGGKDYKIEFSPMEKDNKAKEKGGTHWCKVTLQKRLSSGSTRI